MDFAEFSRTAHGYARDKDGALVAIGEVEGGEKPGHTAVIKVRDEYRTLTVGIGAGDREPALSVTAEQAAQTVEFERPDHTGNPQRHSGVAVHAGAPVKGFVCVDPNALGVPVLMPTTDA